ncbi:hypothetical protein H9Y04_41610 [Streptomyces sp. TRM66268-LWL]|uniref:Uncharacterized protein n=1 Tax=Streptomyces polyasparticus TaxID=2767826 RepID=A0ABR7SVT9_9ACTN|nr:hypothetical protein [Streptomyces polyasparticus]MBC9719042.1 hypothetical protein [Streptomyces polyasparticus]
MTTHAPSHPAGPLDQAALLGTAVTAGLHHPGPAATKSDAPPSDADRAEVGHALRYLTNSGLLSDTEGAAFTEYASHDKSDAPEPGSGLLTVGSVLAVLVRAETPLGLFRHVVDAALTGFLHAGRDAAVSCASIAAIRVLGATKSSSGPFGPPATKSGATKSGAGLDATKSGAGSGATKSGTGLGATKS